MAPVRVRWIVGALRIEFTGDEALFERTVAPLLLAACRQPAEGGSPERESPARAPAAAPPEPAPPGEEPDDPPAGEDASGFVPRSPRFSRFLQQVGSRAANPEQQLVAFAFYLWNYEDRRQFDRETLLGCFEAVGLPAPEGLTDRIQVLCERKRFLARVGDNGLLQLTTKGVNYVKTRLLGAV